MVACLEQIGNRFKLKEYTKGVILALGLSIPEMTTNIISINNPDK